jgi:hypothetical protein
MWRLAAIDLLLLFAPLTALLPFFFDDDGKAPTSGPERRSLVFC